MLRININSTICLIIIVFLVNCNSTNNKHSIEAQLTDSIRMTTINNDSVSLLWNKFHLFKDNNYNYDSIIVVYDAQMWTVNMIIHIGRSDAFISGQYYNNDWLEKIDIKDNAIKNLLVNTIASFYITKTNRIFNKHERGHGEHIYEGDFPIIEIMIFTKNGITHDKINLNPFPHDYNIEFSEEFLAFTSLIRKITECYLFNPKYDTPTPSGYCLDFNQKYEIPQLSNIWQAVPDVDGERHQLPQGAGRADCWRQHP